MADLGKSHGGFAESGEQKEERSKLKEKKKSRVGNRNRRSAYVDDSKTLSLTETCGNRGCKGKKERYRVREEEKERETEKRNSREGSHTLITRMLYAC